MKKARFLLMLTLIMLVALPLIAINDVEGATVKQFKVIESSTTSTTLEFTLPEFKIISEETNGMTFNKVETRCDGYVPVEGLPELPVYSTMIAIPYSGSVSLEVVNRSSYQIDNFTAYPAQDHTIANESERSFSMDADFYNSDTVYPVQTESISEPGIVRDFRVVNLTFSPYTYNPSTRTLNVSDNITYRINYTDDTGVNEMEPPVMYSPSFQPLYESLISNYDAVVDRSMPVHNKRLLIIYGGSTDQQYIDKMDEFITWKRQKGYKVTTASTSDIGSSTADVKAYIQSKYNNIYTRPEYVNLIGDTAGALHVDCWTVGGGASDYPYTQLAGTDTMGDVFIGRMPVETVTHFLTMANKVFTYERDTIPVPPTWWNHMLLAGYSQASGQSVIYQNKFMKYAALNINPDYTFTEYYGSPSATNMTAAINTGVAFFVYRGYLGMNGWDTPSESQYNNANKLPHCIINTCSSGNFNQSDATDSFVRFGTPALPKGGLTAIGMATSGTHTLMNNVLTGQTIDGIFNWGMRDMSAPLLQSKLLLYMIYNDFLPQYAVNFPGWCNLMGDPTVEVFIGDPQSISADYPSTVLPGQTCFPVYVEDSTGTPMEGALVTLVNDGMQLIMNTDANGNVVFELPNDLIDTDDFIVTVSEHDHIPVYETIQVLTADGIAIDAVNYDDAVGGNGDGTPDAGESVHFNLTLANSGSTDLINATVEISSDNPYLTIVQNSAGFGDITVGATATSDVQYQVQIAGDTPPEYNAAIKLEVVGTDFETYLGLSIQNAMINVDSYQLYDNNGILEPGETTWLNLSLINNGAHGVGGIYAELLCESSLVYFEDGVAFYGNSMPGSVITNITDGLSISARGQLLAGSDVEVIVHLYNDEGYDDYQKFYIPTGSQNIGSPTGPDDFGHYIYHSSDTGWPDAPVYNWIGIAPAEGGSGTEFAAHSDTGTDGGDGDITGSDTIDNTDLPFTFTFYGVDYDEVYVCTNGFFTFIPTEIGTFRNFPIPGPLSPDPMIAPFWDDMYFSGTGGMYHWYDSVNHLFVIEWYNATCGFATSYNQQFQVILYDPEYYPTSTGDGMIKFQYHTFNDVDAGDTSAYPPLTGQYSTIGFSDHTGTDGIQYVFDQDYGPTSQPVQDGVALLITGEPYLNIDPYLTISDLEIVEANGNGFVEPGEFIELNFDVVNSGMGDAVNVSATLTSTDVNIGIITSTSTYELIPGSDGEAMNTTPFTAMISPAAEQEYEIPITLTLELGLDTWTYNGMITVLSPQVEYVGAMLSDHENGNGDGNAESGESFEFVFSFNNNTIANMNNVTFELACTNANIVINDSAQNISTIPANRPLQIVYPVDIPASIADGSAMIFTVTAQGNGTQNLSESTNFVVGNNINITNCGIVNGAVSVNDGTPELDETLVYSGNYGQYATDTGDYKLYLPVGVHNVTAELAHYAPNTENGLSISNSIPIVNNADIDLTMLSIPTAVSGSFDARELTLVWTAPVDIGFTMESYDVYRSYDEDDFELIGNVLTEELIDDVSLDGLYSYYVVAIYNEGISYPSVEYFFDTAVAITEEEITPIVTELYGNFPNPFNPVTNISYSLAVEHNVTIDIYNIKGQLVRSLVDETQSVGKHVIQWDGTDNNNNSCASGLYMYRFQTKGVNTIKKAMLLK